MVSSPANVELFESHSGADTMPVKVSCQMPGMRETGRAARTILDQNRQALLDQQLGVEDDQSEAQRQHVVTRPDLEEITNPLLLTEQERQLRIPDRAERPLGGRLSNRRKTRGGVQVGRRGGVKQGRQAELTKPMRWSRSTALSCSGMGIGCDWPRGRR